MTEPLAERMRPKHWKDFAGQQKLLSEDSSLRKMIEQDHVPSMILWGPPGTGKTSIARFIADKTKLPFYQISAIDSGVKEIRAILENAKNDGKAILFIDEIHRFNKSQQDALLGAVESGTITLIGATTENPSFEVNRALLSRSQVFVLSELSKEDLEMLIHKALKEDSLLSQLNITIQEIEALLYHSGGDARRLYNVLEIVINALDSPKVITNDAVEKIIQLKSAYHDKSGDLHYDLISAFIKSIRGSDPNAALFYLAKLLEGGEAPEFIARRLLILSSEDIGLANPNALLLANTCFEAVQKIGYPECDLILSQTTLYLATSPKSNSSYLAIRKAQQLAKEYSHLPIPLALRNAPTKLMKELNYGKEYQYAHNFEGNFASMEFLPPELKGTQIYSPSQNAKENEIRAHLRNNWKSKYGY
jgi:putative ATPase